MDKNELPHLEATPPDMYLSNGEAALVVGVCPSTLRGWARSGRLEHMRYFRSRFGWRYFRAGDVFVLRDAFKADNKPLSDTTE